MKSEKNQKLIFVYNADSGIHNMIWDTAHKIFSPSTYNCKLCDITYGSFSEKMVWKKFRKESAMEMQFLHKDEFLEQYELKKEDHHTFPQIFMATEKGLKILVHTAEINQLKYAEDLIDLIQAKI